MTTNKIFGAILIAMAFAVNHYGAQSSFLGFIGGEVSDGERFIAWAIFLTGGAIAWCMPTQPDKK